jgi:hypothetical protein
MLAPSLSNCGKSNPGLISHTLGFRFPHAYLPLFIADSQLPRRQLRAAARTNAMPRSRSAPLRAAGGAACSACSRRFQRARGELLERMGSHGSRVAPHATLAWC